MAFGEDAKVGRRTVQAVLTGIPGYLVQVLRLLTLLLLCVLLLQSGPLQLLKAKARYGVTLPDDDADGGDEVDDETVPLEATAPQSPFQQVSAASPLPAAVLFSARPASALNSRVPCGLESPPPEARTA